MWRTPILGASKVNPERATPARSRADRPGAIAPATGLVARSHRRSKLDSLLFFSMEFMKQQRWSGFATAALLVGTLGTAAADAAQPSPNPEEWTEPLSVVKSSSDEVSPNSQSVTADAPLPSEAPASAPPASTATRLTGVQPSVASPATSSEAAAQLASVRIQPEAVEQLQASVSGFDLSSPLDSPEAMAVLLPPLELPQPIPEPEPQPRAVSAQSGMASWYGPGFHGNRSASGEVFNQYALTAAHRTLPFGTRVRVTNLNTGQSVIVRINDRGPFSGGRIIDLSRGAAGEIGMISSGTARVRVEVLE